MRRMPIIQVFVLFLLAGGFQPLRSVAQTTGEHDSVIFTERNMSGPRLGFTFLSHDGNMGKALGIESNPVVISQFGWHSEYVVKPAGGGPSFVVQLAPMVAGVEYGKFIPSATLAFGIRLPSGIEFGMGPNVLFANLEGSTTSLAVAAGYSFDYGGVSIPFDIVLTTNPKGNRVTLIFGYAISKH